MFASHWIQLTDYQGAAIFALLLLALLILREVARVSAWPRRQAITRALTIVITPLVIVFIVTVTLRVAEAFW